MTHIQTGRRSWYKDVQLQQYLNVLDELGYFPLSSKAEEILYDVAKKSIERLGESASKALLDHICSINGLSERNYLRIMTYLKSHYTEYSEKGLLLFFLISEENCWYTLY